MRWCIKPVSIKWTYINGLIILGRKGIWFNIFYQKYHISGLWKSKQLLPCLMKTLLLLIDLWCSLCSQWQHALSVRLQYPCFLLSPWNASQWGLVQNFKILSILIDSWFWRIQWQNICTNYWFFNCLRRNAQFLKEVAAPRGTDKKSQFFRDLEPWFSLDHIPPHEPIVNTQAH